jgi:hypothetical protein
MLLEQNSNTVASIMREAIVAGFGVEGFWCQELYRMIFVKSVIGYRQFLRFSDAYMPLVFFLPVLSRSADLSKKKTAQTYIKYSTTCSFIF